LIESWIPITFAAAFLQNLRSALQKHLKGQLSTAGATFSRFLFAAVSLEGRAVWSDPDFRGRTPLV